MNISNDYPVMIFKTENQYGTFYKAGISKKDINGNYINGYKDVRFKKEVQLEDRTKIVIKKAWLDFYIKNKRTIDYIFISEFEMFNEDSKLTAPTQIEEDPFMGVEIDEDDLPF